MKNQIKLILDLTHPLDFNSRILELSLTGQERYRNKQSNELREGSATNSRERLCGISKI